jgi:hypothetical protein
MVADLEGLEGGDGHLGYCAHIGVGFTPDGDIRIHWLPCRRPEAGWGNWLTFEFSGRQKAQLFDGLLE